MMASIQDGRASPIMENELEGEDYYGSEEVSPSGCSCFCLNWWRRGHGSRDYRLYQNGERGNGGGAGESWLASKLKGVKEASEVVAGPKWKTFIRKAGGYFKEKKNRNGFGYDAESYALNFDKGIEGEEDAGLLMSYSSRFVGPPPSH